MRGRAERLEAVAGVAAPVGVAAVRRSREALISAYLFVVVVVSCSSAAFLLVAADTMASNWLSSCSMMTCGVYWEATPWKMPWCCCAADAVSKISLCPMAAAYLRSNAAWRGLKKDFQAFHV